MSLDADRLFALLPAVHRLRDVEAALAAELLTPAEVAELATLDGLARQVPPALTPAQGRRRGLLRQRAETGPLRSLLAVMAEQLLAVEESVAQLYDDQFIETCAEWVVPYIGDLVGYVPIRTGAGDVVSRAEVADTIRLRRAKGTAAAAEGVARDVTGRDAAVAEYFRRTAATQNLNHLRPAVTTAPLRDALPYLAPGGPFDPVPRSTDLRAPALGGRHNIPNVGVFLWPWRALRLYGASTTAVDARRFLFSPLGQDLPLVQKGAPPAGLSGPGNVARALTRRETAGLTLEALADAFRIAVGGAAVDPATIRICCLADTGPDPTTSPWANMPGTGVAVDPELGRIAFAQAVPAGQAVTVDYAYAGVGLLGGGPYGRGSGFDTTLPVIHVSADAPSLAAALPAAGAQGAVEVAGNARIEAAAAPAAITVAAGARLEVRAADGAWPVLTPAAALVLGGGAGAELTLDGFLIAGAGLVVPASIGSQPNGLRLLRLRHCTLVPGLALGRGGAPASPGAPSLSVAAPEVQVELVNCVLGPVELHRDSTLRLWSCVLDAGGAAASALSAPGGAPSGPVWAYDCTVRGAVRTAMAGLVSNCLLLGPLVASQRQSGIVRFSFVADGSSTPRRYSCLGGAPPALQPARLGEAGYARLLSASGPASTGADDGGEIGAFHDAHATAQREGLAARLAEFLPFGRQAGLFDIPTPHAPRSTAP